MKTLREFVEKDFGLSLDMLLPKGVKLYALDNDNPDKAYLFGSAIARKKIYFIQGHIHSFLHSCPESYFIVGHAGYGSNSYAFYLSRVDKWSKLFYRLPYGGCYMDNDKMAKCVNQFLINYLAFEPLMLGKVNKFIGIDSMGDGYYHIVMHDGQSMEIRKSFIENPNFMETFGYLLNGM